MVVVFYHVAVLINCITGFFICLYVLIVYVANVYVCALSSVRSRTFSRSFWSLSVHSVGLLTYWSIPAGLGPLQPAGELSLTPVKVCPAYTATLCLHLHLHLLI